MGKGHIFVFIFSVVTIVLFCVLIYLMGDVNPPPIGDDIDDMKKNTKNPEDGRRDDQVRKLFIQLNNCIIQPNNFMDQS